MDRPPVSEAGEQREPACVVQVRVGEYDGVEVLERSAGWQPIGVLEFPAALEEATVDENVGVLGVQQVRRAGHFPAGRTEQSNLHQRVPSDLGSRLRRRDRSPLNGPLAKRPGEKILQVQS